VNPFFRAREVALRVRAQLAGSRADDPVPAAELLGRVEDELNLAIQKVHPKDKLLGGGKATLRRTDRFIYVREDVGDDELAYLASHELGHHELDPDVPVSTTFSGSSDFAPASVATYTVEAYGARERDELQKNVFARELLLPRTVARDIFLKGVGPRKAARDLGLPLEVVRQQMLDAVLLPDYTPPDCGPLPTPSPDQQRAIDATEKHVQVVAGPGTGKTTTLIHRVKKLIEVDGVNPRHILVLTFTNKAAAELVDRLQRSGVTGASEIWAGTFHAFGLEFLRKYYQHFGLEPDLAVADKLTQLTLTARALAGTSLRHYRRTDDPYDWLPPVVDVARRLKEEMVSPEDYLSRALVFAAEDSDLAARFSDVATVVKAYMEALKAAGMVDFVDLVATPALAIRADRAKYSELADRFQYVLVDEYQDLTNVMIDLVAQLSENAKSLWVVGDLRQAIYHWRGASLSALRSFSQRFPDAKRYDLTVNRRSTKEIIDISVTAGTHHRLQSEPEGKLAQPECLRGACGGVPTIWKSTSRESMWDSVASEARWLAGNGAAYRQQAILCRAGAVANDAAKALTDRGVPVAYLGDLIERPEIKDILALIQLLVERVPRALMRVHQLTEPVIPIGDVLGIMKAASTGDVSLQRGGWLNSNSLKLSPAGEQGRQFLRESLKGLSWNSSPWSFICDLLLERRFLLGDIRDASLDASLRRVALWQFAQLARTGDGDRRRPTLARFMHRLRLRQQVRENYVDRELPPEAAALDGIRVMTIHGSKGLEFDAVHLCAANGVHFDGSSKENDLLPTVCIGGTEKTFAFESEVENNNLLYVAVSRARDRLKIYENSAEPYFQPVAALQKAQESGRLSQKQSAPSSSRAPSKRAVIVKADRVITFEELRAYDHCPRQYFYQYHLELGRELSPNPALHARGLVNRALHTMAKSGKYHEADQEFSREWKGARLPEKDADPQLWDQAITAYGNGIAYMQKVSGSYKMPTVQAPGLRVQLPWGLVRPVKGALHLHVVGLLSGATQQKRMEKLLGQLMSCTAMFNETISESTLFDVSRQTATTVAPEYVSDRSVVATRTRGISAGEYEPSANRFPCSRCAYHYVCPALPAELAP
jgi:superfamily I DNA/RNA helicase